MSRFVSRRALEALEPRRFLSVTTYDLSPGSISPTDAMPFGSRTVFSASGDGFGRELWITDGASDTRMIADLRPGSFDSNPIPLADAGGYMYFYADGGWDVATQRQQTGLWRTNGKGRDTIFLVPGSKDQFTEAKDLAFQLKV